MTIIDQVSSAPGATYDDIIRMIEHDMLLATSLTEGGAEQEISFLIGFCCDELNKKLGKIPQRETREEDLFLKTALKQYVFHSSALAACEATTTNVITHASKMSDAVRAVKGIANAVI